MENKEPSLLDKLDSIAPIREFDAFPKVPTTYTSKTSFGGIATVIVIFASILLSLNDIGEFLWGWPDYEFGMDTRMKNTLNINLDMVVNMPCGTLSIDIRDMLGDRMHLTNSFSRDGTTFDVKHAQKSQAATDPQSVSEIVTAARKKDGGFFAAFYRNAGSSYKPKFSHVPSNSACRIHGSVEVRRVTANLHITTLGHGYNTHQHVDHQLMNLSHVINDLSFGPYFPSISQPLDNTYEVAEDPFMVYQYFLDIVPTVYHPARSSPLRTNQYSATGYQRPVIHGKGTPGIFIKYDIDPIELAVYQRTTKLVDFLVRIAGIIGGVFVCASWAVKVGSKAVVIATGKDETDPTIPSDTRSPKTSRWTGATLRARGGGGWGMNGSDYSPSGTPIVGQNGFPRTPNSATGFSTPATPFSAGGFPTITSVPPSPALHHSFQPPPPSPFTPSSPFVSSPLSGRVPPSPAPPSPYSPHLSPNSPAPRSGPPPSPLSPRPPSNLGPGTEKKRID